MPIVVDPGFQWPPESDPVVSPDGKLTAIVDPAHAGVLLRADFNDSVPDTPAVPEKIVATNLLTNPSYELNLNDVRQTQETATLVRATFPGYASSGSASLWATGPANPTSRTDICLQDTPIPVEQGSWVGFSVDVRPGLTLGTRIRMILWSYANGTPVLFDYKPTSDDLPEYAFKRISWVQKLPDGANSVEPWISVQGSALQSAPPANWRVMVDSAQVVSASTQAGAQAALDAGYFDGDTEDGATDNDPHYRWAGTPHASASEKYLPATPFVPGHGATTAKVRFERQDGSVVRSGNPAWAPGGYAHSYDHEATLGGGTLWRAVPIRFDGTEGEPSEYVGAVIPPLSDGWAWLKPVTDPDKAMLLKVEPPDLSYDGRVDTTSIAGAPRPAATWDILEGFTTQLRSLVREKNVEEHLKALLNEGPVLAQFPACAGLPDFYFIRGKLDLEHVHWDGWPWRRYQWEVIQIDRPDTTDSPLRIPGLAYDTVERDWTTYDQLKSTVVSYNKLLEP